MNYRVPSQLSATRLPAIATDNLRRYPSARPNRNDCGCITGQPEETGCGERVGDNIAAAQSYTDFRW